MEYKKILKEHLDTRKPNYIIFKISHIFPGQRFKETSNEDIANRRKLAQQIGKALKECGVIELKEYTITIYSKTSPKKYLAIRKCGK